MVSMRSEKPLCAPPRLSEVSPLLLVFCFVFYHYLLIFTVVCLLTLSFFLRLDLFLNFYCYFHLFLFVSLFLPFFVYIDRCLFILTVVCLF